jgi:hypothetical protein
VLHTNCGGPGAHECKAPSQNNFKFFDVPGEHAADPQLIAQINQDTHEFFLWEDPNDPERALMFGGSAGSGSTARSICDLSPLLEGQPPPQPDADAEDRLQYLALRRTPGRQHPAPQAAVPARRVHARTARHGCPRGSATVLRRRRRPRGESRDVELPDHQGRADLRRRLRNGLYILDYDGPFDKEVERITFLEGKLDQRHALCLEPVGSVPAFCDD